MFLEGEKEKLIETIRRDSEPKVMLEIGCHLGKTANECLRAFPSLEKYYGVEIQYGHVPTLKNQEGETPKEPGKYAKHDHRFKLLLYKNGSFDLSPYDIGIDSVDVAFIDGDHSERAVRCDTALCRRLVRKGGIIIWHDYGNPFAEVAKAIAADIFRGHITYVPGTWLAYEIIQ